MKVILEAGDQIVAAAANGVYQGILLALLVAVCLRFSRSLNAATRHAIWFTTLGLVAVLIPAHLLLNQFWPVSAREASVAGASAVVPSPPREPNAGQAPVSQVRKAEPQMENFRLNLGELSPAGRPPTEDLVTPATPLPGRANANGSPESQGAEVLGPVSASAAEKERAVARNDSSPQSRSLPQRFGLARHFLNRFLEPFTWNITANAGFVRDFGMWFLGAWMLVAVTRTLCLLRQLGRLRRLKRQALPVSGPADQVFQKLCRELKVNRPVTLRLSSAQRSPVLLGFIRPVILLPEAAPAAEVKETEHLLRHELAHVLRRDDWANLAQHFIHAALFFHPAVYWISRQLSLEREIACDDYVLQPGGARRDYALLLTDFASRIRGAPALLAPGVSTNQSQLKQRITMILNTHRNTSPRLAKTRLGFIVSTAVVAAFAGLIAGPRLVLAQSLPAAQSASAASAGYSQVAAAAEAVPALPPTTALSAALARADGQPGANVAPGPKPKPESDDDVQPPMALPVVPRVSVVPPVAAISVAPAAAECPPTDVVKPARAARHDATSAPTPNSADSIERRLERLERLLNSIMAQQSSKLNKGGFAFSFAGPDAAGNYKYHYDANQIKEDVKREVTEATEQAKRAMDEAKKAAEKSQQDARGREADAMTQKQRAEAMRKDALQSQLDAVRKARESLQRELERLDHQIERLKQDQERKQSRQSSTESGQLQLDIPVDVSIAAETAIKGD